MKIALIQCPVWGTHEPPLSLSQLSGCLKSKGHAVRTYDLNNYLYLKRDNASNNLWAWEQSYFWYHRDDVVNYFGTIRSELEKFACEILSSKPEMIGFSVAASSYEATVEFSKILYALNNQPRIIMGGTGFYDGGIIKRVFDETSADYVISDEADAALPELASLLEKGKDISACKGVYYRDNSSILFTGERINAPSLDDLPYLDFTDTPPKEYDADCQLMMMSSRGCVWKCAFCSSSSFASGYRSMSGERLYQEIVYQMSLNPKIQFVNFADLAFNGDMRKVVDFCQLMIKYPPYGLPFGFQWMANVVVSPLMTKEALLLMKQAGCIRLIFGIESGSGKVLELMRKRYDPEVAVRVIKDAHDAGISVTCNFMFGFPGESEDDFLMTLDFLKRIAPYVGTVYPSRTFCAIEENSYFYAHPEDFGIKTPFNHHLYWETLDGNNTYPMRMDRCRRFEELCSVLGVKVDCGVQTSVELDKWFNLGAYYEFLQDFNKAIECYSNYLVMDPCNKIIIAKAQRILKEKRIQPLLAEKFSMVLSSALKTEPLHNG